MILAKPKWCVCLVALLLCCNHSPACAKYDSLIAEIRSHALMITSQLRQNEARVVGVLKFRVIDHSDFSSSQNRSLGNECADWLEASLRRTIAQKGWESELKIVPRASDTASQIAGANHRTKLGREKLFSRSYPLDDGSRASVDTFLTGQITLRADLRSVDVDVRWVSQDDPPIRHVALFHSNTSSGLLGSLGMSFQRREWSGDSDTQENAISVLKDPESNHPAFAKKPLVSFTIKYDGIPVIPKVVEGLVRIPEPMEGQKVTFKLERLDPSDRPLAAVVKVNGENVLWRRRVADFAGPKYVLEKGDPPIEIRGFQEDNQHSIEFSIATRERSKALESHYDSYVGSISLTVFTENALGNPVDQVLKETALMLDPSDEQPIPEAKYQDRGLIIPGNKQTAQSVRRVESRPWDPDPLFSCHYYYYTKQSE